MKKKQQRTLDSRLQRSKITRFATGNGTFMVSSGAVLDEVVLSANAQVRTAPRNRKARTEGGKLAAPGVAPFPS